MTSEYTVAVYALVYLNRRGTIVSSEELAGKVCTNPSRIRKIMAKLRKDGLVETKEGANGGYCMCLPASQINLRSICEALGEAVVKAGWKSGGIDRKCLIASGMGRAMEELRRELDELGKAYLEKVTIESVDRMIFENAPSREEGRAEQSFLPPAGN